jgi:IMP and pyridine-specific 5'-nucleotidase
MQLGVHVAIVTAAGYPGEAHKFERRLTGLLDAFRRMRLPAEVTDRFHIMGGECNYLLRVTPDTKQLEFVDGAAWRLPQMEEWDERDISATLDAAQNILTECAGRHGLPSSCVRKERAVGIVPCVPTIYEVLEDIALTVQTQLAPVGGVPFCAFNGGNDVFVDIGNKSLGLEALMAYTGARPQQTIHVGDRFTLSGNDAAARDKCSVVWVANPEETSFFIRLLTKDVVRHRREGMSYIE